MLALGHLVKDWRETGPLHFHIPWDRWIDDNTLLTKTGHVATFLHVPGIDFIGKLILRAHVETCVAEAFISGSPKERKRKIEEVMESISKLAHVGGR